MPGFAFRDRLGEWLNLSGVDDRSEVSTAILQYVIDVNESLWCRACRSADCEHTAEIERVFTIAGLGSEGDSDAAQYVSLPPIDHITQYHAIQETIAACWFENGARLRYHESDDGSVNIVTNILGTVVTGRTKGKGFYHLEEYEQVRITQRAWVAKPGQRRSVEGAVL
jgi:hypothetical protein